MLVGMVTGVHVVSAFRHVFTAAIVLHGFMLCVMLRHHLGVSIGRRRRLGRGKRRGDQKSSFYFS